MNLKQTALGFVTAFLVTLPAMAGTVGVFRVADGQIVEVSDDGSTVVLEATAYNRLKLNAKNGDQVILDGGRWTVVAAPVQGEPMKLTSDLVQEQVALVPDESE
jgi:hypothetical protein